jgi:hypothetical protein
VTLLKVLGNRGYWIPKKKKESIFRNGAILGKLTVRRPVKKSPTFYATSMFITLSTTARHLSLSRARLIPSTSSQPISLRLILILSFHSRLGFLSYLFSSDFHTSLAARSLLSNVLSPLRHHILFKITFNIILSFTPRFSK